MMENVLELFVVRMYTSLHILKVIDLCTFQEWILLYVNYSSIIISFPPQNH